MWFKQTQIFQLTDAKRYTAEQLVTQLAPFAFTSCLPSFPSSTGWISPVDVEEAPLVHALNGYIMLCLQVEEKILPATVIRQELLDKIKHIEVSQDRKVRQKEKLTLKDEITMTLLPRAFSRLTRVYGYIDTKHNRLILSTTNGSKTEQFLTIFRKSVSEEIYPYELKKLSPMITQWLKDKKYPTAFSIEKACVLQDPQQQNRVIRCQHQDLFAQSIQAFIKDGCEVKQLALCWHDRVNFMLAEDFTLRSIQYNEEILAQADESESETKEQQFAADFFIMTETLTALLQDLLNVFVKAEQPEQEEVAA
jgi:recombination associated protein RdgC